MGHRFFMSLLVASAASPVLAQGVVPVTASPSVAVTPASPAPLVILKRDTPVELMATSEVSTADAKPGTTFKLRVNRAINVDGRLVVPVGATAFGEVLTARDSGGLGKSGQMSAKLLHIKMGDAIIPIEGETSAKGQGAGSAGAAVLLSGFVGLFHRGNNAKIKAGELLSGFVSEDVTLDLSGPVARRVAAEASQPAPL